MDGLVEQLSGWLKESGPALLIDLGIFILLLIIGKFIISMVCRIATKALKKTERVSALLQKFALDTLRKVLWIIVMMFALPRIGIDVAPLIAGLGVAGFVIGFAFQETLGNLASGVMILLNQPFKNGDFVSCGGHSGTIRELNLMATTMTTGDNKKITIPNKSVWGGSIINFSAMDTRRVDLTFGIGYTADIAKARETLLNILSSNSKILRDPEPLVEVVELADSSVNFVCRPWCASGDYWTVYFEVTRKVKEEFDKAGLEIPFPQMDVHLHKTDVA
ncbi:mechanosensitive ion channel family protein [Gemmatimonas aurantiaca]|nr:mechanosensitive ion channel family protein [Gemmatimonas aurantiaca]